MMQQSIYDRIKFYVELAGVLPEDFEVEIREYKENELRFAPGAWEGILGHHTSGGSAGDVLVEKVKGYLTLSPQEALEIYEGKDCVDGQVGSARRGLGKNILEHREEFDASAVFELARYFAVNGTKTETVKLGLSLLVLLDTGGESETGDVLRVLGCCEEFTDYVLAAVESWTESDKQELYFTLARKLQGWGKINAVERMEADTEEKKQWLLCHGCKNSVMNAYLGYVCAVKCDFRERLEWGNLSEEEFRGASEIMEGLLDEGPCRGLSAMEHPAELAMLYLEECGKHFLDVDMVVQLADIREYFADETNWQDMSEDGCQSRGVAVLAKVDSLLASHNLFVLLMENVEEKPHQCIRIANAFNLDISGQLIGLMERNFSKYYQFCYYLFGKDAYVEEFFGICEREVREEDYPRGMGNSLGFSAEERKGIMLDVIVQHMGQYPLCGKKLIRICLRSPITRWRNMAGRALQGWVNELGGNLADIDSELYDLVEDVAAEECNESTKETWKRLLVAK